MAGAFDYFDGVPAVRLSTAPVTLRLFTTVTPTRPW